jgi:N-acyl-D-amino-acid deacylase
MLDLKLQNCTLYDGTGNKPEQIDIGVLNKKIIALGSLASTEARQIVDCKGLFVCPGFIDVHSHSDTYLLIEPAAPSKIYQGVSTEIIGNCGASAAPIKDFSSLPSDWLQHKYPARWTTFAEYLKLLQSVSPALNVLPLVGHSRIRSWVMDYNARPATQEEISDMQKLLQECMEAGAAGLSTGLIYAPGKFAAKDEIIALVKVVARCDGIYTTHMRSEASQLLEAIKETIEVAKKTGVRLQISHLKTSGKKNWHLIDEAFELIRKAREDGLQIAADRYPYIASSTDLDVIFPSWAHAGGRKATLKILSNKNQREKLYNELKNERKKISDWATIVIGSTTETKFRGMPIAEAANILNLDCAQTALWLAEKDQLTTQAFFAGMSEKNMWKILAEPYVMIGSDASTRAITGPLSEDFPHPRAYGTFPKFLRASIDGKTVSIEEAIYKMTKLPADHFKIKKRGIIKEDYFADIVAFDPEKIRDKASYANPHQLPEGIKLLIVNGAITLNNCKPCKKRNGKVLQN